MSTPVNRFWVGVVLLREQIYGSPPVPLRLLQNLTIPVILEKDDGLFCSDWRKGAVFSQLISGGNRSPELVEGNAEPRFFEAGHGYVAEKIPLFSGRASELRKSPSSLKNRRYAKLSLYEPAWRKDRRGK
jgi:hypothetical protein